MSDWQHYSLKDLISIKHGFAFDGSSFSRNRNNNVLLTPGNFKIEGGIKFDWEKQKFYNGDVPSDYVLKKGDLIIALTDLTQDCNILGSPAIVPDEEYKYLHNQRLGLIKAKEPEKLINNYLFHYFNSEPYRFYLKSTKTGTTVSHTSPATIYSIKIQLPPFEEQQKIADILSTVDEKIEVIEAQIAETEQLKKGLMQRLLTKGIGHTKFKDSPLGEIPEGWTVTTFNGLLREGIILQVQDGNHGESHPVSSDFVTEGVPFIMANCISTNNKLILDRAKRISSEQYKSLRIGFSRPGDVLLTHKGTIGLTALVEEKHGEIMLTPQVTYYRIGKRETLTQLYLYYFFQSQPFQKLIAKLAIQSTRAYIGITSQKQLPIIIPGDIDEQIKISEMLSIVDEKLDILNEKRNNFQDLKKSLMQKLLTGKIRVTTSKKEMVS
jgi:type I restriction enzyme S subunit